MDAYKVIEQLLHCDEGSIGRAINTIADEFRRGGDLRQLRPFLTHPDANVAAAGAWIVAEVADASRGREVLGELRSLAAHPDPGVRFEAISSLPWLVRPGEIDITRLILRALDDDNAGVRRHALTQVCVLPGDVVEGMRRASEWSDVRVLAAGATREHVRILVSSNARFLQRLGVAGAIRNYGGDSAFIAELAPMFDDEVEEKIADLLQSRRKL